MSDTDEKQNILPGNVLEISGDDGADGGFPQKPFTEKPLDLLMKESGEENAPENDTDEKTENAPENDTDEKTESAPENDTEEKTESVPENDTDEKTEDATENNTDEKTENAPEKITENKTEDGGDPVLSSEEELLLLSKKERKKRKKAEKRHKKLLRKQLKKNRPKRRSRFITPLILLVMFIGIIIGCCMNIDYCKTHFEVTFYQVESLKISTEIRIVVISDVHLSEYGDNNDDLIKSVKALHPDLIISAGDMVTYGVDNYDNMLTLTRRLSEIAPFYGVMGNHEDEKTYLENDEKLRDKFADAGMKLLINTCEKIKIKNNDIELVGVSGGTDGFDLYGGKKTMDSLDENTYAMRICVAHVPALFKSRLEKYDFDLGIAGHTHGGVVRLPILNGLYSAEEGFLPKLDGGIVRLENKAPLFISRGLGNSGKIPRFNNTPELAVIDVRWY